VSGMRVLIADNHEMVRRGLRDILIDAFPGTLFSEAGNADEALSHLSENHFDLLLLDIDIPHDDGMDLLCEVKDRYPDLPVMVVSVQAEDEYAKRCMHAGAAAYITKDRAPEELAQAAKTILGDTETNRSHLVGLSD
jgi:two-component system invasion response regulator UvrY